MSFVHLHYVQRLVDARAIFRVPPGDLAYTAECSQLGVGLPEVSFRSSWSVCADVPDADTDASSEHLVTTGRFR